MNSFQKFWIIVGFVGILLAGWVVISGYILRPTGLTVIGEGKLTVVPDTLEMVVTKVTGGVDVVKAIDDNDSGIRTLTDVSKGLAGADAEIRKTFYQVTPQSGQYLVASAFSIKSRNVSEANGLVKLLYQSGATSVSNVQFSNQDQTGVEQQARVMAVKDSKAKATKIAASAGKKLGRLVSISDDNSSAASSVGTASNGAGSLSEIEIIKRVQVVYEMW
jgi:uncharacterized protein YggE